MLGESLETSAVLIKKHAKPCRDLHLGELGLIGVVEDVWGGFGMFGGGLGMLGDVWRIGKCCGSIHLDFDGREFCSGFKIMNRERESRRCCRR